MHKNVLGLTTSVIFFIGDELNFFFRFKIDGNDFIITGDETIRPLLGGISNRFEVNMCKI